MKKIITLCLCLCLLTFTGCGAKEVKKLTADDIKTYTSKMKTDPLSGDITLNGIKYTLPIKAKSFEGDGWKYNDYEDKGHDLKTNYYVENIKMDDGTKSEESRIIVTLYNTSKSTKKFDEAMLGGIEVDKLGSDYKNTVVLPKGITLASTYKDVISAYGKPKSDAMKQAGFITYDTDSIGDYGQQLKFEFDTNTQVIKSIKLKSILDEK